MRKNPNDEKRELLRKNLRILQSGMTQSQMAEMICMSRQTYSKRLKDPLQLTLEETTRICRVFGVSFQRFCEETLTIS